MTTKIQHPCLNTDRFKTHIKIENITTNLFQLRQELEEIAPLADQHIPADQLLFKVCEALDLPVLAIHKILGSPQQTARSKSLRGD